MRVRLLELCTVHTGRELSRNACTAVVCCSYANQDAVVKVALDALDGSSEEEAEEDLEKLANELRVYQDLASLQGSDSTEFT